MIGTAAATADDRELVPRLRAGDEEAFEELVRLHTPRMLRLARRLLQSEEDARDAVQDAFAASFRSIRNFGSAALLSTWLYRIVVNACLMKLRTRRRKPEEDIEQYLPRFHGDGHHAEAAVRWAESPETAVQRRELAALVRQAIDELPDGYRTVLLLRDIEELSTDEVAATLRVTPNAVKIRLHRARQALRTLLDPHMRPAVH